MFFSKKITSIGTIVILFSTLLSFYASAAVTNCRSSNASMPIIQLMIPFDITASTSAISPGTQLAIADTQFVGMSCDFTGPLTENHVYFKNSMSSTIKNLLLENGVEVTQKLLIGEEPPITITNSIVDNIHLGAWPESKPGPSTSIGTWYQFTVIKGNNSLKPFDTGMFLLGTHVNAQGHELGNPIFIRIMGNLTILCPSPTVGVTASNGGSVNFGAISPKQMNEGGEVSVPFNLNMSVSEDCETGLNISVRIEPNNNTILGDKYLDMGNGLQTVLNNHSTDLNYNQNYPLGTILPLVPMSIPYTATLTKIPGSTISSGPFSKTIRVVVSY